jgi:hypothetical protein
MDGATYDFIVIPIVMIPILAGWLAALYWMDSHPRTLPRTTAWTTTVIAEPDAVDGQADTAPLAAGQVNVPRQATAPSKTETSPLRGG